MTHLISEHGDLTLVSGNYELTGTVKEITLEYDIDDRNFYSNDYVTPMMQYRDTEDYTITAKFVPNESGVAYTIKELRMQEHTAPVYHVAETELTDFTTKAIKAARKRAGAPKGAQYVLHASPEDLTGSIKFSWTTET